MSISLWRVTHLWLAVISSIFLLIASATGAILSFEPIYEGSYSLKVNQADDLPIGKSIELIKERHEEILNITRDANGYIAIQTVNESEAFYINPFTGEKIGALFETPRIFDFCRTLHRSLFLGKAGRFLIGLTSVFLLFIAISGFFLILKKQGGLRKYFSKVVKNEFYKDYHSRFSRWMIISIVIISISGAYLFLERFNVIIVPQLNHTIEEVNLTDTPVLTLAKYPALAGLRLEDLREVNFPFAEFREEYYEFKLKDRELLVNQFSGEIISEIQYPIIKLISQLSFDLHTGEGTIIWSLVLCISSIGTLFFIYTGFAIYLKREKNGVKNPFRKADCPIVILVGSEQGSTHRFANALQKSLIREGQKVYLTSMNKYEVFEKMKHMLILTSTYGVGEAPSNANTYIAKLRAIQQNQSFKYAVLGFGSKAYPDFCQFAIEVDQELNQLKEANQVVPLHTVNNESKDEFISWVKSLEKTLTLNLPISDNDLAKTKTRQFELEVLNRECSLNELDSTFVLKLRCSHRVLKKYRSGDIMSIVPPGELKERLYSMSVDNDQKMILLSVRKHQTGVCSSYLSKLNNGDKMRVSFKSNAQFHFPADAPGVIMIANGTGIAPFLGMIATNNSKQNISLFWGGQNKQSLMLYNKYLQNAKSEGKLNRLEIAFSREEEKKQYVQNIVSSEIEWILTSLSQGFVIMICGGLAMQKGVEEIIAPAIEQYLNLSLDHFKEKGLIKTDCY
jgi:sulfite reductase (NADPH) flavoprotein alpha-component